jgi:hypothetical protein
VTARTAGSRLQRSTASSGTLVSVTSPSAEMVSANVPAVWWNAGGRPAAAQGSTSSGNAQNRPGASNSNSAEPSAP